MLRQPGVVGLLTHGLAPCILVVSLGIPERLSPLFVQRGLAPLHVVCHGIPLGIGQFVHQSSMHGRVGVVDRHGGLAIIRILQHARHLLICAA